MTSHDFAAAEYSVRTMNVSTTLHVSRHEFIASSRPVHIAVTPKAYGEDVVRGRLALCPSDDLFGRQIR